MPVQDPFSGFLEGYMQAKEQRRQEALEKAKMIMEQQRLALEDRRVAIAQEHQDYLAEHGEEMWRLGQENADNRMFQILAMLGSREAALTEKGREFDVGEEGKNVRAGLKSSVDVGKFEAGQGRPAGQAFSLMDAFFGKMGLPVPQRGPSDEVALPFVQKKMDLTGAQTEGQKALTAYRRSEARFMDTMSDTRKALSQANTDLAKARARYVDIQGRELPATAEAAREYHKAEAGRAKAASALDYEKIKEIEDKLKRQQDTEAYLKAHGLWTEYLLGGNKIGSLFKDARDAYEKAVKATEQTKKDLSKASQTLGDIQIKMRKADPDEGDEPNQGLFDSLSIQSIEMDADVHDLLDSLAQQRQIEKAAKERYYHLQSLKLESDKEINKRTGKVDTRAAAKTKASGDKVRAHPPAPFPPRMPAPKKTKTRVDSLYERFTHPRRVHSD